MQTSRAPRLSKFWENLRSSLWFVPALLVLTAVILAGALIELDERIDRRIYQDWPRLFGAGAEGARGMLTAIATSMMTVAGVAFSITIVALSLAASQYTSRVLRTFLRDRANQIVLGVLVGIFAYCVVVLRSIRDGTEDGFVPPLAVLFAVVLAFVGIGCLIFYIHHIATSIQASYILAAIGAETADVVDHLFPEGLGEQNDESQQDHYAAVIAAQTWRAVPALETGYIQRVDADSLLHFAQEHDTIVRMECGVGEFVIEGMPLVSVAGDGELTEEIVAMLNGVYAQSRLRTVEQDPAFSIRQMVDMALKALSPGINDSTTAVMCIDYLTANLVRLASRRIESPYRLERGELRVVTRGPTFESLLALALDQIRQNAQANVAVLAELFRALETVAMATGHPRRRRALLGHVEAVQDVVQRTVPAPRDRAILEAAGIRLAHLLGK